MDTIGSRVRAEREAQKMSRQDLSARTGVGYSTLAELERGGMQNTTKLRLIADALGVSQEWLETGRGAKAPAKAAASDLDWQDVVGYSQAAGLGAGAEAEEYAETHSLKFKATSLRRQGLQARNLAIYYGKGDSMEPTIKDGDAILFDTSDTRVVDGGLYLIQLHGAANAEYYVKRAEILAGIVFFRSDNPTGDHGWKKPKRMDSDKSPITVVGRVRWIAGWVE
ncbi:XRE family transcriptional regulator [Pseudoxanthomonas winnipegensis]|uniref:LexA family transcriptional regulator n=1 Tax=Pseudoxanthomonas winnipegensis TaxID=2480810 RepID=A0A4Q8L9X9_9GAMM|nr:LexA family transcriptional regulator [Pseudoxanthomonas winnipegensis]RZZ81426.1 LexA family transcriptional regulator [Pseudoxanthomonas winnipegensis]TAA25421.1 LexA family transcriptional regulator [Pseudoxanthomonas winnipegensis]